MGQALLRSVGFDAPQHVLVADDSEVSRALLKRLLMRNGYVAHEAESGEAALRAAEQFPPDLILLDLRLPDIDGSTVLGYLRAKFDSIQLPIIMVSAEYDGEVIAGCCSTRASIPPPREPTNVAYVNSPCRLTRRFLSFETM